MVLKQFEKKLKGIVVYSLSNATEILNPQAIKGEVLTTLMTIIRHLI